MFDECKKPMISRKITRTIAEGNRHRKNTLATILLRTLTRLTVGNIHTSKRFSVQQLIRNNRSMIATALIEILRQEM